MPTSNQTDQTGGTDGTAQPRLYPVVTASGQIFVSPDDKRNDVRRGYSASVLEPPSENTSGWNASTLPETSKPGTSDAESTAWTPLIRVPVSQAGTKESSKTAKSGSKQ